MQYSYSVLYLLYLPKQQLNKSGEVRPSNVLIRLCYVVMTAEKCGQNVVIKMT